MKKLSAAAITTIGFLSTASLAFAQVNIGIEAPKVGIDPKTPVGTILSNSLYIIVAVAALLVLVFLIIGAFNWITSGGDKEKVGGARKTIFAALIGLAILALSFLIVRVVGQFLNIDITGFKNVPTLQTCIGKDAKTSADAPCVEQDPQKPIQGR